MPRPRKTQISLDATPYYHCISRCVRRAFLCGFDALTGQSFEHRKQWVEDRLLELAGIFAIDLCAFAVMSSHIHVVLHVDAAKAQQWSDHSVVERWHKLFSGNVLSQRFLAGETLGTAEREVLGVTIAQWRQRLSDISWFMRCLNEPIAREANQEDGCTGRFWEGRFKSQALVDEKALLACMAYVDLNPIRAGVANTPEQSDHTSVQQRINAAGAPRQGTFDAQQPPALMPFVGGRHAGELKGLPFHLTDYLALVDWTGRALRDDKPGAIPGNLPPILDRLALDAKQWGYLTTHFESRFKTLAGAAHNVRNACHHFGRRWVHGIKNCQVLFPSA